MSATPKFGRNIHSRLVAALAATALLVAACGDDGAEVRDLGDSTESDSSSSSSSGSASGTADE